MSTKQTLNLIESYLNDIQLFMKHFSKKYNRNDVLRAWHDGDILQQGNITDDIEYELHGIGCCIIFPDKEVEFDFGPESRFDGFDLWRLKGYLEQCPTFSAKLSEKDLEASFNALVKDGAINKVYESSNLYFFRETKKAANH